ncbi:hypothetical protein BH11PSE10_BH11PSE10_12150 [soil metagenome]
MSHRRRSEARISIASEVAFLKGESRPDKPNEDWALADDKQAIYIVCDGVTRTAAEGRYPVPSPAASAAKIAAEAVMDYLSSRTGCGNPQQKLEAGIAVANDALAAFNREKFPIVDYFENDFAGTVIAVVLICGSTLHYGYVGDCTVRIARQGQVICLTPPQTEKVREYRQRFGYLPASTITIRRDFRNNLSSPYAYGCLTGQGEALGFIVTGCFDLLEGDVVFVASDGVERAFDASQASLGARTAAEIVGQAAMLEGHHAPDSDDKTLIRIATMRPLG